MSEKFNKTPLPENIAKNLVFIDGISRCGKSIFSSIIPSFERFEHLQVSTTLENIIPAIALGGVERDTARMLLRIELNQLSYNIQLSRNVNFRKTDQTGITNYKEPEVYLDRLNIVEGDDIVNLLRTKSNSIPFQTHNLMPNLDIVNDLRLDYKILEIYRHPIDNLYSWWTQGWGIRFDNDPRSFTFLHSYNEKLLPWFCEGKDEQISISNPYEKCILMGADLIKKSIDKQKKSTNPEKIITIFFEDMLRSPNHEIKKLENFLGKNKTKHTSKFIEHANCPRRLDTQKRAEKLKIFKGNISPEIFDLLIALSEYYEKDHYGLQ
jgi:hypothetical protein